MPIESNCPGCGAKVRVPESLIGKSVKCPKCQSVFTAEAPEPGFEEVVEEEPRPRRRRPDDEPDDQYEDEYEPRPRRRGGRQRALEAVKPAAICVIVAGGLGFLYAVVNLVFVLGGNRVANFGPAGANDAARQIGSVCGVGLTFIWAIIVVYAGIMMLNLRNYSSVMIGVIFGMLPCNAGCFLGLPFGIWALVVLNRPDVKRAFG
jgi:predicted Zn finger-like uncharacterized protein